MREKTIGRAAISWATVACVRLALLMAICAVSVGADEGRQSGSGRKDVEDLLRSLGELSARAAEAEYRGMLADETQIASKGVIGGANFESARRIYYAMLNLARQLEPKGLEVTECRVVLSRIYTQIGVFVGETKCGELLAADGPGLIEKAIALDPENAVALYAKVKLKAGPLSTANVEELIGKYDAIVKLDGKFPEAWLELGMAYAFTGDKKLNESSMAQFYSTLASFKPELHFFDDSYPPKRMHIVTKTGDYLKRDVHRSDQERFYVVTRLTGAASGH